MKNDTDQHGMQDNDRCDDQEQGELTLVDTKSQKIEKSIHSKAISKVGPSKELRLKHLWLKRQQNQFRKNKLHLAIDQPNGDQN